jgi:hypothetical protein
MVYIPGLPKNQRMALARVTGAAEHWGFGDRRDRPRDQAVAALHAITRDPFVLGIGQGEAQADERPEVVELLAGGHEALERFRPDRHGSRDHGRSWGRGASLRQALSKLDGRLP